MRTHFYGLKTDGTYLRVRLRIPGVCPWKLEMESSLHTYCNLWEREIVTQLFWWQILESSWYFRLSDRIGEVLKGE